MARMPSYKRSTFLRDCLSAWEASDNGVTAKTNTYRQKKFLHWEQYTSTAQINTFLDPSVPLLGREIVAGSFVDRVRTGKYGRGNQIKFSLVSDALKEISMTIDLARIPRQIYRD